MSFHKLTYEVRKLVEKSVKCSCCIENDRPDNKCGHQRWEPKIDNKGLRLRKWLPILLDMGLTPYCTGGSVTSEKVPCSTLKCEFKKNKDDLIGGCSICEYFWLVLDCTGEWEHAIWICESRDVTSFKGLR